MKYDSFSIRNTNEIEHPNYVISRNQINPFTNITWNTKEDFINKGDYYEYKFNPSYKVSKALFEENIISYDIAEFKWNGSDYEVHFIKNSPLLLSDKDWDYFKDFLNEALDYLKYPKVIDEEDLIND